MKFDFAGTVEEALQAMAAGARPVAGGTDLVVAARQGKAPMPDALIAIDQVQALSVIESTDYGLRIGAGVTHATLMIDPVVIRVGTALADASALVGSPATRNVGTLGGNVMNASPAMDTGAPLLALGATAELRSLQGTRHLTLDELWLGPGRTAATPQELCIALTIPTQLPGSGSAYVRLEYRRAMEIAIVGAAAVVTLDSDGKIAGASVALAAVAPTIVAVDGLEQVVGSVTDEATLAAIAALASEQSKPISDIRASDRYRAHCVGVMARRAVEAAARRAAGENIGVPVNRTLGIGAA